MNKKNNPVGKINYQVDGRRTWMKIRRCCRGRKFESQVFVTKKGNKGRKMRKESFRGDRGKKPVVNVASEHTTSTSSGKKWR